MNTAARLLAMRLLVEAEPEPEPKSKLPNPAPPDAPGFDVKDWIVNQDIVHAGVPEPSYYQRLSDQLGNRTKKKLNYSTYLFRLEDGSVTVRFHTTNIVTARPDGIVTISTYGTPNPKQMYSRKRFGHQLPGYGETARSWRTPTTLRRLMDWLPCGWIIFTHGKSSLPSATSMVGGKRGDQNWWWANTQSRSGLWDGPGYRIPFSDYDQIDTKSGELKPRLSPVPVKGKGSNPPRTSGYGFGDKFYEGGHDSRIDEILKKFADENFQTLNLEVTDDGLVSFAVVTNVHQDSVEFAAKTVRQIVAPYTRDGRVNISQARQPVVVLLVGFWLKPKINEHKKIAPAWTETGGVFGDFTAWPKVDYYAKCPKCGHVHGDYKTMREAHSKRLCPRCDLEHVERIKDAVARVDTPGMTPKKVLSIVGKVDETFDVRAHILGYGASDWVFRSKQQLEDEENLSLEFEDDDIPDQEPNDVDKFELRAAGESYRSYWVFKSDDIARAYAEERVANDLEHEPELFSADWIQNYLDTDKLTRYLAPEDSYLDHENTTEQISELMRRGFLEEDQFYTPNGKFRKITPKLQRLIDDALEAFKEKEKEDFDPIEYLKELYGEENWLKQAFEIAPLYGEHLAKAAEAAVNADGWPHFVASYDGRSIDLGEGVVAARTN